MKTLMMNMAGVKSEKEFYKRFPDEASFMKVHGKAFKKVMLGKQIEKAQNGAMSQIDLSRNPSVGTNVVPTMGFNPFEGMSWNNASQFAQPVGDLIGGIQALSDEKKKKREAYQSRELTSVLLKNSRVAPEPTPRYYTRPEDIAGQDLFPVYGTGTEVLGKYGVEVPKAQNGFVNFMNKGGADLATNISRGVFDYNAGERVGEAVGSAVSMIPGVGPVVGAIAKPVLGLVGGAIDELFGPAGKIKSARRATERNINNLALNQGARGVQNQYASYMEDGGKVETLKEYNELKDFIKVARQAVGTNNKKILTEIGLTKPYTSSDLSADLSRLQQLRQKLDLPVVKNIAEDVSLTVPHVGQQIRGTVNQMLGTHFEDGGNINPQIIKTAGGIPLKDFKRIALEGMDTLRTGGNIRQNTMNGDLQVYNGGAEPISYNPYLPEGGETVEFKGPSHAEGGMDVAYGRNPVEVEGGEPAVKLNDGGSASNLVVFGNLKDPRTGIKFKKEAKDISKKEDKANKTIRKSIEQIGEMDVITPYDRITYDTLKVMADASDTKLKKYAEQKQDLAAMQEAINSTAEEMNLSAEHLAEGKIKTARKGTMLSKAQEGENIYPYGQVPPTIVYEAMQNLLPYLPNTQKVPYRYPDQMETVLPAAKTASGKKAVSSNSKASPDKTTSDIRSAVDEYLKNRNASLPNPGDLSTLYPTSTINTEVLGNLSPDMNSIPQERDGEERYPLVDFANAVLPYFRPTNAEPLDTNQLLGEMYSLSQNRVEPVQAQGYHPLLEGVPPSVSLQSNINEIVAQSKGLKKLAQYNPALAADIASRTYEAVSEVKGKEAMINQAQKNEAYNRNRAILNDAQLKNLGIADTQYMRQAQAQVNTKETALAALNSISDKYLKNKLENKTLQAYENLYNYRYDARGRAINLNPLAQFNTSGNLPNGTQIGPNGEILYPQWRDGKFIGNLPIDRATIDEQVTQPDKKVTKASSSKRNGAIVKAINNL